MLRPPEASEVAPDVLFRSLLVLPRPTVPLRSRIRGAEDIQLSARALSSAEAGPTEGWTRELVAAALMAGGKPVFASVGQLEALLSHREVESLGAEVLEALGRVSPTYATSLLRAWTPRLLQGCKHVSNQLAAFSLGGCAEVVGDIFVDRPDRYFGVPPSQLIDCHWFAYRAARAYFLSIEKT